MLRGTTEGKGVCILSAAFAVFSVTVALGWTRSVDLWTLRKVQELYSPFLDVTLGVFSTLGGVEITATVLLALLAGLFLQGRQRLALRILAAFVATTLLELALKFSLPQPPVLAETTRREDYAPLLAVLTPYPYPSGHMLRAVILLGSLYFVSNNRMLRISFLAVLSAVAANRIYFGAHWASDVLGGALLGLAGLLWAFKQPTTVQRLRSSDPFSAKSR